MSTFDDLSFNSRIARAVADYVHGFLGDPHAYRGQQLRGGGPIAEFEQILAETCGFPYCLATCNATTALLVIALAADLRDAEIIGPPNCWPGSIGPFEFAGGRLVRAKPASGGTLCPESVERLITKETRAVLAVDWEHSRHDAPRVRQICDANGLLYIEDSALIPGVTGTRDVRSVADVQVLSFGPGKPMTLGEGGAVLTRSRQIYENAVLRSQHPERWASEKLASEPGPMCLNARIHPLAAFVGIHLLRTSRKFPAMSPTTGMQKRGGP